jgi:lysyl-tRNA synthetase class 2
MASQDELRSARLNKIEKLKSLNINPYPARAFRDMSIKNAVDDFDELSSMAKNITLAGRIHSLRGHGKILFADLHDEFSKIQLVLKFDILQEEKFSIFKDLIDSGDFLQVSGTLFKTEKGEKSLSVSDFKLLTKSLLPLPDDWYGLEDVETRLRKRYIDLALNPDTRKMFRQKSVFWQTLRQFLLEKKFLEVETPVLENVPGGADAEPFVTHHNALDRDFYLRISLELPLKRLLVGGFEKVFEIGRIFRNEGIDKEHLQDYTQLEFYWAYADYNDMMKLVQEMYQATIQKVMGGLETKFGETIINWGGNWPKVKYFDLLSREWGIDARNAGIEDLYNLAEKFSLKLEKGLSRGRLMDQIYKKTIRPKLIQPQFLILPPVDIEPLAKRYEEDPNLVERFQVIAAGSELGKGFSELNDPQDQLARFQEQMKLREKGDKEAQRLDEDFVEALEYGMPPTAGFGLSERLFAVLMDKSVRETVIFPPMHLKNIENFSLKNNLSVKTSIFRKIFKKK